MIINGNNPFIERSYGWRDLFIRFIWNICYLLLFRYSPRPFHFWRALILQLFGAKIGVGCHVYPGVTIWSPWNLSLVDHVVIGDGVVLYSMAEILIGDYSTVSQGVNLCCGTHDYNSSNFQLFAKPIEIGSHAWICSEAFIHPGVSIPDGVVVGARSVVTKNLPDMWSVYSGNPAKKIGTRKISCLYKKL